MKKTIAAHFDGTHIVPDERVDIPVGRRLRLRIEFEQDKTSSHADLSRFIGAIDDPNVPSDLSVQHDHYLYGTPKR